MTTARPPRPDSRDRHRACDRAVDVARTQRLVRRRVHRLPAHRDGGHGHLRAPPRRLARATPPSSAVATCSTPPTPTGSATTCSWSPASLLLGFLGAVHVRLRRADATGVLATVARRGRHPARAGLAVRRRAPRRRARHGRRPGTDVRILAGWDAVAPYSLAFSVLPRALPRPRDRARAAAGRRLARGCSAAAWPSLAVSLVGSATLVTGALFPVLALSTLAYELWIGALAWHWLREGVTSAA